VLVVGCHGSVLRIFIRRKVKHVKDTQPSHGSVLTITYTLHLPNGLSIKTIFSLTPATASLKAMIKPGQIIGQTQGGEPDMDHFYACPRL
jgi:hypothetical protein